MTDISFSIQTRCPSWVLQKDCPEAVIDHLPTWKQSVISRLDDFLNRCLTAHECNSATETRLQINLSFTDYYTWACEQTHHVSRHMNSRYGLKVLPEHDMTCREIHAQFTTQRGGSVNLKICLRS